MGYRIIDENMCASCNSSKPVKQCEELPRYCDTYEEASKSVYLHSLITKNNDTVFDELEELEDYDIFDHFVNCLPHGFITKIQFMDESGYNYPTCGNAELSDDECFG